MLIKIETDSNIEGDAALAAHIKEVVNSELDRFGEKITRVSVHLSDQNSEKKSGTADMRCQVEARLAGLQPISVSDEAGDMRQAIGGAVRKLKRALASTLGRLDSRQ